MICLSCRQFRGSRLCGDCRGLLRPSPPRVLEGTVVVRSAFLHAGPARELVHVLKYQGIRQAARVLAAAMDPGDGAACLVPVPRVLGRRLKLGIDPAVELARALGGRTGLEVFLALEAPITSVRHAGRTRAQRPEPSFSVRRAVPDGAVLVDDVITTGSTMVAALKAFPGVRLSGVTATAVPR